jgi:hypothetical protein
MKAFVGDNTKFKEQVGRAFFLACSFVLNKDNFFHNAGIIQAGNRRKLVEYNWKLSFAEANKEN